MKKKKYLPLYEKWIKTGRLPNNGLCAIFPQDELFDLIDPEEGAHETYWGYEGSMKVPDLTMWYEFTTLRQNVVLLMAAMAGELEE